MSTTRPPRGQRRSAAIAAALLIGLVLSFVPSPTAAQTAASAPIAPSAAAAVAPVPWEPCDDDPGHRCATYPVPLDHADPSGPQVVLALRMVPATGDPAERIGSLFVNPGGPGGSGTQLAATAADLMSPEVRQAFDVVGFDPRGVGASRPAATCPEPASPSVDADTDWDAHFAARPAVDAPGVLACTIALGRLAPVIGTRQVAEDLDLLRRAVGDASLTYWGGSYGTRIGLTYAALHPTTVRAMILDGSIGPDNDQATFLSERGGSYDVAYTFFRHQVPSAAVAIDEVVAALSVAPDPVVVDGSATTMTVDRFLLTIRGVVGSERLWPELVGFVDGVHADVVGGVETPVDAPDEDIVDPGLPGDDAPGAAAVGDHSNALTTVRLVNCLDLPRRPPSPTLPEIARGMVADGPHFGPLMAAILDQCDHVPLAPEAVPTTAPAGVPPLLLISSEHDPATPRAWSERMHAAVPGSRLLRYDGVAHVAWNLTRSTCVDDIADGYVLTGVVPDGELHCPFASPLG